MKKSNFLSCIQIWAYPEHPPPPVAVEVCGDCIPQGYHLVISFCDSPVLGILLGVIERLILDR